MSDGAASSTETIRITVTPTNQAPRFASPLPRRTQEQRLLQFTLVATDPDGDAVVYAPVGALPQGAEFDGSNGRFTWTPGYDQAGEYTLRFGARDAGRRDRHRRRASSPSPTSTALPVLTLHQPPGRARRPAAVHASPAAIPTAARRSRSRRAACPRARRSIRSPARSRGRRARARSARYLVTISVTDGKSVVERGLVLRGQRRARRARRWRSC